jgi:hypothetical protein
MIDPHGGQGRGGNGPPPAPSLLPRPGTWIGVSDVGHEDEEMVGGLPTLFPSRTSVVRRSVECDLDRRMPEPLLDELRVRAAEDGEAGRKVCRREWNVRPVLCGRACSILR